MKNFLLLATLTIVAIHCWGQANNQNTSPKDTLTNNKTNGKNTLKKDNTTNKIDSLLQLSNTDPRLYLLIKEYNRQIEYSSIIYEKTSNKKMADIKTTVDNESLIYITIKKDKIADNPYFFGNISLAAIINNEAIKVSPYSKVGQEQGSVGIKSATPSEVANHLKGFAEILYKIDSLNKINQADTSKYKLLLNYLTYFQNSEERKKLFCGLFCIDDILLQEYIDAIKKNKDSLTLKFYTDAFKTRLNEAIDRYNIKSLKDIKMDDLNKLIASLTYSKLVDATIDLREARAKEGDVLTIYLLWYNSKDSLKTPIWLEVASYKIKELNFRLKVVDSFFLISRINDPKTDINNSPSRFKGAAGVSLLYSYGNNSFKNSFLRKMEPSFGLNISYLDFYTNKDLEIGVGFVAGLLRERVFLIGGYNLHAEKRPLYFGVGFSFANLAKKQ